MRIEMGNIEIYLVLTFDAELLPHADVEDRTGGNVTGYEVPVGRVHLFEEVPRFALLVRPDTPALPAYRLGHQAQFIFARYGRGVHLDEFAVSVLRPLLVDRGSSAASIDHRVGRASEEEPRPSCGKYDRLALEGVDLHAVQVLGDNSSAYAVIVQHGGQELPVLVLVYFARDLLAAHLLVQSVEELLAGGRASVGRPMVEGATEPSEVEVAFGCAVEHHAHAVEQEDDARP